MSQRGASAANNGATTGNRVTTGRSNAPLLIEKKSFFDDDPSPPQTSQFNSLQQAQRSGSLGEQSDGPGPIPI